jgi:hypothetical protein
LDLFLCLDDGANRDRDKRWSIDARPDNLEGEKHMKTEYGGHKKLKSGYYYLTAASLQGESCWENCW